MDSFNFKPIAHFCNSIEYPNEAPRQPNPTLHETSGTIRFLAGYPFQEALQDLSGFSHIWVLFQFHKNAQWNPLVMPPRGSDRKRSVFATRSPYRPNPIGMSVLNLISIEGLVVKVGPSDLLNGTPILDIKPYIHFLDSHPEATLGWLTDQQQERYIVQWNSLALEQLKFLEDFGLTQMRGFIVNQLEFEPDDTKKKRIYYREGKTLLAYRTWRIHIQVNHRDKQVAVLSIHSAYDGDELRSDTDPYLDKALHRIFTEKKDVN